MLPTYEYKSQVYGQPVDSQAMPCPKLPFNSNIVCVKHNNKQPQMFLMETTMECFNFDTFFLFSLGYMWPLLIEKLKCMLGE